MKLTAPAFAWRELLAYSDNLADCLRIKLNTIVGNRQGKKRVSVPVSSIEQAILLNAAGDLQLSGEFHD